MMSEPAVQQDTRIQLASAEASRGDGTHKASVRPWTDAGGVAGELRQGMQTALTDLEHGHDGIKSGTEGFASASTLGRILGGWQSRLEAVRNECGDLDGKLKKAGIGFGENETTTKESFDAVRNRSKIDDYAK
ncbi:hypothetical protein [Streptomyces orinoci]|uniref:Uncharacterized protein n=1 Tax=Streptomyces orinoci TaxID=67339 RepID=A0ABV3K5T3_STRON|nr:hypothetical protein [Streptomyces orinoci]